MSADPQWFVMQGEEQLGPYTGELLVEYATAGNITRESLIWTEGMAEWLPAGQVEGIFPAEVAPVQAAVAAQPAQAAQPAMGAAQPAYGANPYAAPGMQPAIGSDDPYPNPGVKSSSFGMWVGLFLGSIALIIIGFIMAGSAAASAATTMEAADPSAAPELTNAQGAGMGIGAILVLVGYLMLILSVIPMYINLYRAWSCLQPGGLARSTPGKAVGFMFIPFFNYYWLFMAFNGLAKDWNQTVATYSDIKAAPKMSEGIFLTFCIGCFLPPLGPIMLFPVMSQMCKGINFFAFRPVPGQAGVLGGGGGGALGGGGGATGGLNLGGGFTVR